MAKLTNRRFVHGRTIETATAPPLFNSVTISRGFQARRNQPHLPSGTQGDPESLSFIFIFIPVLDLEHNTIVMASTGINLELHDLNGTPDNRVQEVQFGFMARLIQQSKEAVTASPSPVHSQQVHVQPSSYPWHVNEPTPTPMAVPNQLHPFQLVDPANSNPNPNLIPVNQSGQNVQPGGQYNHPIWQRPMARAWGQSPWGHL